MSRWSPSALSDSWNISIFLCLSRDFDVFRAFGLFWPMCHPFLAGRQGHVRRILRTEQFQRMVLPDTNRITLRAMSSL